MQCLKIADNFEEWRNNVIICDINFMLDEVKASKRIIDNETEISQYNQNCTFPNASEFLFGINLPDQALVKSDYDPKGDQFSLSQF